MIGSTDYQKAYHQLELALTLTETTEDFKFIFKIPRYVVRTLKNFIEISVNMTHDATFKLKDRCKAIRNRI